MSTYRPDHWEIIRIKQPDGGHHYRVAASWSGGYLQGKSWKINSGITSFHRYIDEHGTDRVNFKGESGSIYSCAIAMEGADWYLQSILNSYMEKDTNKDIIVPIKFEDFQKEFNR